MHSLQVQAILKELHVLAKKHASQQTPFLRAQDAINPTGVVVMCCTQQKLLLFVTLTLEDCLQQLHVGTQCLTTCRLDALHAIQAIAKCSNDLALR